MYLLINIKYILLVYYYIFKSIFFSSNINNITNHKMKKSTKIIIVISILVLIGLGIGLYFILTNKPSSNGPSDDPNVGWCRQLNGVPDPNQPFFRVNDEMSVNLLIADGTIFLKNIDKDDSRRHKFFYDPTNPVNITRKIKNTELNEYSPAELLALGKTDTPDTYLVNSIVQTILPERPWILTTRENCQ